MPKAITCRSYSSYIILFIILHFLRNITLMLQICYRSIIFLSNQINYLSNLILKKYTIQNMELTLIYTVIGFGLAAYSVIANDSVQTLGTFIASNQRFKWYWLATAGSAVLAFTLIYGSVSYTHLTLPTKRIV